jgi:Lysylphosphatidylglycerol synthase TM region
VSEADGSALPPGARVRRRVTPGGIAAALFGAALFAWAIQRTGPANILVGLHDVGWGFLLIVGLSGARLLVRAWAWTLCTEGEPGLRIRDTFPAFLTGDALGNLTPLGLFASEATKAVYVRHRVPLMTAISGLTIENLIYTLSVAVVIVGGTMALLLDFTVSERLRLSFLIALGGMVALIAACAWIIGRQVKVMTGLIHWLHRRSLAPHALAGRLEKLRTLEDTVYGFHRRHPLRLLLVVALEAAYHAAGVAEVYVTLSFLDDKPPSLVVAFILETANRLTNVLFKFVPMRLGVDEAGSGLLITMLGDSYKGPAGVTLGVTLAIVRKVRMLVWTAVGVFFLARRGLSAPVEVASPTNAASGT